MKNHPAKNEPCGIEGCETNQHARGVCRKHYYQLRCEEDPGFRERMLNQRRAHYRQNPARSRGYHFQKKYGLTLEDFDRLLAEQDGRCAICARSPKRGKHLVVDHDHDSGDVRALLCSACNKALGFVRDDPIIAEQLACYLLAFGKAGEDIPA